MDGIEFYSFGRIADSPNELTWEEWCKLPSDEREEIRKILMGVKNLTTEQSKILMIPTPEDEVEIVKEIGRQLRNYGSGE